MPDQRDTAIQLMKHGKFAEALPILLNLLKSIQDNWMLYNMAGQCFRFTNNIPDAIKYLTKAVSLNSENASSFLSLGIAFQLAEEYESALVNLKRAAVLDPLLLEAYNSIGLTYCKIGRFNEALEWYSKALEGIIEKAYIEAVKNKDKCFAEVTVEGSKGRIVLPYLFEKMDEIQRLDPMFAVVTKSIMACKAELGILD